VPRGYTQLVGDTIVIHNTYSNTLDVGIGAGANLVGSTSSAHDAGVRRPADAVVIEQRLPTPAMRGRGITVIIDGLRS
jgi:hypothetical protein